jgi:hypothetical protein
MQGAFRAAIPSDRVNRAASDCSAPTCPRGARSRRTAWVELSCRLVSGTDEYVYLDVGRHDSRRAEKLDGPRTRHCDVPKLRQR